MVYVKDTLMIKHLPSELTDNEKEVLLKHFGAVEVKCLSSKVKKYNIVFARFQNEQIAYHVLHRLHQLPINGTCLSVEFSKPKDSSFLSTEQCVKDFENEEQIDNEKCYKRFIEKLTSWHSSFNFKEPIPCHLRYQYPPPDTVVLLNIVKVLATVPKFYTQVLHLMNKMNLPCPFRKDILPDFNNDLSEIFNQKDKSSDITNVAASPTIESNIEIAAVVDTSESELSSDEEIKRQKETIPDQIRIRKRKVMNLKKFVKPMPASQGQGKQKKTNIDEIFEKVREEKNVKKIKLSHPAADVVRNNPPVDVAINNPSDAESSTGFGYIHPVTKHIDPPKTKTDHRDEREEERLEKPVIKCVSPEELAQNRIPEKDRSILPVFKNYAEGAPTSRLYIKNLAKGVTEEDLRYIYNRYLAEECGIETQPLDIRLMQEGRMKGQAFITLNSVQLAQTALKETNGYILKEKPLVVQFARSAAK